MVRQAHSYDYDFIHELYFHPLVNPFLLYEMKESANFSNISKDLMDKKFLYIFEVEGKKAGMFKLVPFTYRTAHAVYLGGVAIHPNFMGKGLGMIMMQEIIDFSVKSGFNRIELSTATTNQKALHLYEKVGFQREGVLRRYTYLKSENRYLDEVVMSYLAEI
jgi:L-phenylalanine/L-methionine N-acetyltransferase